MEFPIRINKYLAQKKICSRREADELIAAGKVEINNQIAQLGQLVSVDDKVTVGGVLKKLVHLAFNKPKGIVTHSPQGGERSIADILKLDTKVSPVGRLDKQSRGLIILTNDGRIIDRLLNPDNYHEKEYEVKLNKSYDQKFLDQMQNGVKLDDGYVTRKCVVRKKDKENFSIVLTEGKKRQIRRMCLALGYNVVDLNRVRIMNIKLNDLPVGKYRTISDKELQNFMGQLKVGERKIK